MLYHNGIFPTFQSIPYFNHRKTNAVTRYAATVIEWVFHLQSIYDLRFCWRCWHSCKSTNNRPSAQLWNKIRDAQIVFAEPKPCLTTQCTSSIFTPSTLAHSSSVCTSFCSIFGVRQGNHNVLSRIFVNNFWHFSGKMVLLINATQIPFSFNHCTWLISSVKKA